MSEDAVLPKDLQIFCFAKVLKFYWIIICVQFLRDHLDLCYTKKEIFGRIGISPVLLLSEGDLEVQKPVHATESIDVTIKYWPQLAAMLPCCHLCKRYSFLSTHYQSCRKWKALEMSEILFLISSLPKTFKIG